MTYGSPATEIDQRTPLARLALYLNRGLIHHGAEITVLRDPYRASRPT